LPHLGDLASSAVPAWRDPGAPLKAVLFLHRTAPEQLITSAPVRIVLIPQFAGDGKPGLVPIRPADALRAVAPAALWQMHLDAAGELEGLRKLLTSIPAYVLLLSPDRAENVVTVRRALDQA